MPLQKDLERSVNRIFSSFSSSSVAIPSSKGTLYELYLFLISYQTIQGLNNTTRIVSPGGFFKFRSSPGVIKNSQFTYITFTKNGITYELRNGIEVNGYNMYHEIDIAIFSNRQTNNSRPNKSNLLFSVECKNHAKISSLKGEVRKYLGCITDLASGNHNGNAGCLHCGIGIEPVFATPLNVLTNHDYYNYLINYGLNPKFSLKPNSNGETRYIQDLTNFYNQL